MPLDPIVASMLAQMAAAGRPALSDGTPEDGRALLRSTRTALGRGPEMHVVSELDIPTRSGTIPARLFQPGPDPVGLVVYLHGGGWVVGELDDFDAAIRALAVRSRCALLAPDYRLAPEHPFPAGLEDAEDAVVWASGQIGRLVPRRSPLIVAGDSAGGNLAAVAASTLRDRVRIDAQLLIYPVTDHDTDTPSYRAHGSGPPLSRNDMRWFFGHYAPENLHPDPRISPLKETRLAGLPPASVFTAEYDVLRDEGERYARQLAAAGVPVLARRIDGLPHGFIRLHNLVPAADDALTAIATDLSRLALNGAHEDEG